MFLILLLVFVFLCSPLLAGQTYEGLYRRYDTASGTIMFQPTTKALAAAPAACCPGGSCGITLAVPVVADVRTVVERTVTRVRTETARIVARHPVRNILRKVADIRPMKRLGAKVKALCRR
jgi:hypothetical protein